MGTSYISLVTAVICIMSSLNLANAFAHTGTLIKDSCSSVPGSPCSKCECPEFLIPDDSTHSNGCDDGYVTDDLHCKAAPVVIPGVTCYFAPGIQDVGGVVPDGVQGIGQKVVMWHTTSYTCCNRKKNYQTTASMTASQVAFCSSTEENPATYAPRGGSGHSGSSSSGSTRTPTALKNFGDCGTSDPVPCTCSQTRTYYKGEDRGGLAHMFLDQAGKDAFCTSKQYTMMKQLLMAQTENPWNRTTLDGPCITADPCTGSSEAEPEPQLHGTGSSSSGSIVDAPSPPTTSAVASVRPPMSVFIGAFVVTVAHIIRCAPP